MDKEVAQRLQVDRMEQDTDAEGDTSTHPSESDGGKVSWVLNKGLWLGKRFLVAGFVVSTVPVVLPPLVVVSTIGLVCSLPYGFYLASYACTEKLMDNLLPVPSRVDYGLILDQDERQDQGEDYGAEGGRKYLGESGLEGVIDVDQEENEQMMEEAKIGDEMRIELAEPEEDGDFKEESDIAAGNDDRRGAVEREAEMQLLDHCVVQHGYAEDGSRAEESPSDVQFESTRQDEVDTTVAGESRLIEAQGMGVTVKGIGNDDDDIDKFETPFQVRNLMVDEFRNQNLECGMKDRELERETKGLVEKIRDQSKAEMPELVDQILQGATKKEDRRMNMSEDKEVECIENMGDVGTEEGKQVKEEEVTCEQMESANMDAYQTQMETSGSTRGGAGSKAVKNRKKSKKSKAKSHTNNNVENLPSEAVTDETESLASSVVVRNKNNFSIAVKSEVSSKTVEVQENVEEKQKPHLNSPRTLQEGTKTLKEPQLAEDEEVTDYPHANETSRDSPSDEVILTRKKIWEQIDAIGRIVGYKGTGTRQESYVEELKALYVFTGVEPPACFNDSTSDLADVTDKLRFLMSIVGVM